MDSCEYLLRMLRSGHVFKKRVLQIKQRVLCCLEGPRIRRLKVGGCFKSVSHCSHWAVDRSRPTIMSQSLKPRYSVLYSMCIIFIFKTPSMSYLFHEHLRVPLNATHPGKKAI